MECAVRVVQGGVSKLISLLIGKKKEHVGCTKQCVGGIRENLDPFFIVPISPHIQTCVQVII